MSLLGNLFDNPTIRDAAFGTLKKTMKEQGLEYIIVRIDKETDQFKFDLCLPGDVTIIVNEAKTTAPGTSAAGTISETEVTGKNTEKKGGLFGKKGARKK